MWPTVSLGCLYLHGRGQWGWGRGRSRCFETVGAAGAAWALRWGRALRTLPAGMQECPCIQHASIHSKLHQPNLMNLTVSQKAYIAFYYWIPNLLHNCQYADSLPQHHSVKSQSPPCQLLPSSPSPTALRCEFPRLLCCLNIEFTIPSLNRGHALPIPL